LHPRRPALQYRPARGSDAGGLDAEILKRVGDAATSIADAGHVVRAAASLEDLATLFETQRRVMQYEASRIYRALLHLPEDRVGPKFREMIGIGLALSKPTTAAIARASPPLGPRSGRLSPTPTRSCFPQRLRPRLPVWPRRATRVTSDPGPRSADLWSPCQSATMPMACRSACSCAAGRAAIVLSPASPAPSRPSRFDCDEVK